MEIERVVDARSVLEYFDTQAVQAVVVTGELGSGRSTVLDVVARLSPWTTRRVAVNPLESNWPNSGVLAFLGAVPHPRLRTLARQLTAQQQPDPFRVAVAVQDALRDIDHPPTLFLIDNLDDMDPVSREVLASVMGRLAETELRFVVAGRDPQALAPFAGLPTHTLRALPAEALAEMALRRHDGVLSPAVALIVARAGEGNPGLVLDVLAGLARDQLTGDAPLLLPLPLPTAHEQAVLPLLQGLPKDALGMLQVVALSPASSTRLLTDLSPDCAPLLTDLLSQGLIVRDRAGVRVARPVLRSAVYWQMTAAERLLRHTEALAACAPDDPGYAWHAHAVHDVAETALALGRAMRQAASAEQPEIAVEYAERLLTSASGPQPQAGLLGELAYACFTSTEFRLAERYLHLGAAHPAHPADAAGTSDAAAELVQVRVRLGIDYMRNQRILRGIAADALQRLTTACPEQAVELMVVLCFYHLERWESAEAREVLGQARVVAEQAPAPAAEMVRLYGELIEAFESGHPPSPTLPEGFPVTPTLVIAKARALSYGELYAEAGYMYDLLLSGRLGTDRLWVETANVFAVDSHVRSSNMRGALASARTVLNRNRPGEAHLGHRLFLDAWYRDETGDPAGAENARSQLRAALTNSESLGVVCRQDVQMAEFALHTGDAQTALRLLRRTEEITSHLVNPQISRLAPALVEALVAIGDQDGAVRVLRAFQSAHERVPTRWAVHPLGRCQALVAEPEASVALFELMLEPGRAGDMYELGRTLAAYAARLAELDRPEQARTVAETCANHFRELGLPRWATAVQDRFAPGAADCGPQEAGARLSPDEDQLVEMVADGLTNRQVAKELFVSTRTIEARLTTLYRRLGVASRAELAAYRPRARQGPADR